jgi:hypothetical protein
MTLELKDYAALYNVSPEAIRQRIFLAKRNGIDPLEKLPAVKTMKNMGGTWVFTVDKRKLPKS